MRQVIWLLRCVCLTSVYIFPWFSDRYLLNRTNQELHVRLLYEPSLFHSKLKQFDIILCLEHLILSECTTTISTSITCFIVKTVLRLFLDSLQ